MAEISQIISEAEEAIESVKDKKALESIRVEYLGKKGRLTDLLKQLGKMSGEERPKFGQAVNLAKQQVQKAIQAKLSLLQEAALLEQLSKEKIDVTLSGRGQNIGSKHPVTLVKERLADIFTAFGFSIEDGPEIETDFYNFTALNIPETHPARAMQDTFYFADETVLRTHTSPVQIRTMQSQEPPLRILAMGRVYRCDFDVTHTPMFHQAEGLIVDKNITFSDLKGLIIRFLEDFFEEKLKVRFRPSYFPFTEPSAEVDIECTQCHAKGCRVCGHNGWLEVLGCGLVHPNVLKHCDLDTKQYNGLAFGVGIDRLAMLKYKINDLRMLFENNIKFLSQF